VKKIQIAAFTTALLLSNVVLAQQKNLEEIIVEGQFLSSNQVNSVKTPTPIIDVPQSLSIITADQITEQGITSIADIIDYTAGVNTSQGEGHRDSVVFRGVRSTADFYLDGNRDDVQYYRGLYNIEQIEILRGPNALLFGRGGTGGVINRVSKKAKSGQQFTGFKSTLNTFGGFGLELDHNFSSSDTSAFRINAMYESFENHRDFFDGDSVGFNPKARFELSADTTLDLSYEYADHERFIDRGIPTGDDGQLF
jgi:catecholate siderophore receptor